jgi:hypothetical protein
MARTKRTTASKPLTPKARLARETRIIKDLQAGKLSYREIAGKHGVSLPTVNSKARKAGISRPRGRRPEGQSAAVNRISMSRGTVRRRKTRVAGAPGRKTRMATRGAGRTSARRSTTRRTVRAVGSGGGGMGRSQQAFHAKFRELVMSHYPNMTITQYDRLIRLVEARLR